MRRPTTPRRRTFPLAAGLALLMIGLPLGARGAATAIPGTRVALEVPDGFEIADGFAGLQNPTDGSSVMVSELPPEAYSELAALFEDLDTARAGFAAQGVTIERIDTIEDGDRRIPLLVGHQTVGDVRVQKSMTLFGGETTVLVVVNLVDPTTLDEAAIRATFASIELTAPATLDEKLAGLPFTAEAVAPFRITDVIGGSAIMMPTFEGTDPTGRKPFIAVVRALTAVDVDVDPGDLAERLLRSTEGFQAAIVNEEREVTFAGLPGRVLEARSAGKTLIQFVAVPADGHYLRLVARGASPAIDGVREAIEAVAASVAPR